VYKINDGVVVGAVALLLLLQMNTNIFFPSNVR